jgi:hypothetical protein
MDEQMRVLEGTVDAVTDKFGGGVNIAGTWINNVGLAKFNKGDTVKMEVKTVADKQGTPRLHMVRLISQEAGKTRDDEMDFPKLLNIAHGKGLKSIQTVMLEHDAKEKRAVFRAIVTMKDGTVWTGHGDADPSNCTSEIAEHYIRFAETRAIARALRWVTNEGRAVAEEMKEGKKGVPKTVAQLAQQPDENGEVAGPEPGDELPED